MQSEIRNMSIECDKVGGINLSQGICDMPIEPTLVRASTQAMESGENHYTRYDGIERLREEIARKANEFNHINAKPEQVIVSCGATGALYSACYALLSPGDEVILFEPYYGYHEYTLLSLDIKPVFVPLRIPGWSIDYQALREKITPKTKAIILCTPSNPCGKVFERGELETLGTFCVEKDLMVFTDEIYEYITYDEIAHVSPASLPVFQGRTVTVSGFSKTFSITGWRIGYCITDPEIHKWVGNANDLLYVCAPAPLQWGVAEAIAKTPKSFYDKLQAEFQVKRDLLCGTLEKIGMQPHVPKGAYYVLCDVSMIPGKNSKARAMYLLEKTGVGTVPGSAFFEGDTGEGLVRFCFAKDRNIIEEACEKLMKL